VDFAVAVTPLLLAVLGTGFIGGAVGLVVGMYFLAFALLILSIIGSMLMLLVDEFDFYSGENSTTTQTKERDELTLSPEEECLFEGMNAMSATLMNAMTGSLANNDPLTAGLGACIEDLGDCPLADVIECDARKISLAVCVFASVTAWWADVWGWVIGGTSLFIGLSMCVAGDLRACAGAIAFYTAFGMIVARDDCGGYWPGAQCMASPPSTSMLRAFAELVQSTL
jgi:hypothetical protein